MRNWRTASISAAVLGAGALLLTGCHPQPLVSVADAHAREGGQVSFPVSLLANGAGNPKTAHGDVTLYCTTTDVSATAGADYVGYADTLCGTIPAGSTSTTVVVQTIRDAEWESQESFWLDLRIVGPAGKADTRASGGIGDVGM